MAAYSSKIRAGTLREHARKMIQTKYGGKVSKESFQKFLRQDKDLKGYAYKGGQSSISKYKATKALGQIARKAAASGKYKLSYEARRMGVKVNSKGTISDIATKRAFERAAQQEALATQKPTGPTKEEQARETRRGEMLKSFHKRERADEVRKEQQIKQDPREPGIRQSVPTTQISSVGRGGPSLSSLGVQEASPRIRPAVEKPEQPAGTCAVLPFCIKFRDDQLLDLSQKLTSRAMSALGGAVSLRVMTKDELVYHAKHLGREMPDIGDYEEMEEFASSLPCTFVLIGEIRKDVSKIQVLVSTLNPKTNQKIRIAELAGRVENAFELQQRLAWELTEFFHRGKARKT